MTYEKQSNSKWIVDPINYGYNLNNELYLPHTIDKYTKKSNLLWDNTILSTTLFDLSINLL